MQLRLGRNVTSKKTHYILMLLTKDYFILNYFVTLVSCTMMYFFFVHAGPCINNYIFSRVPILNFKASTLLVKCFMTMWKSTWLIFKLYQNRSSSLNTYMYVYMYMSMYMFIIFSIKNIQFKSILNVIWPYRPQRFKLWMCAVTVIINKYDFCHQ